MISPTLSLKGMKVVQAAFDRLESDMVAAADEAIRLAGEEVARDAQSSAPVDSGAYRKSMRSKFVRSKSSPYCRVASWFKGSPSPLGHLLEFGHRDKTTGRFIAGKAHLLPALDRHKGRIVDRIRRGIGG